MIPLLSCFDLFLRNKIADIRLIYLDHITYVAFTFKEIQQKTIGNI